jgi:uncharacterized PurR-regulated membrane protein YhhQ (DUF165 family)
MMQEKERREDLPLSKAALYLLEECRMVLPGMQALFGFQLISVFSETFGKKLSEGEQTLHLVALGLVAIGIALVMTPAAIHRYTGARIVTDKFVDDSTRLLILSMYPLLVGICIDFYLISRIITKSPGYLLRSRLLYL